jgi:hypothetical protein
MTEGSKMARTWVPVTSCRGGIALLAALYLSGTVAPAAGDDKNAGDYRRGLVGADFTGRVLSVGKTGRSSEGTIIVSAQEVSITRVYNTMTVSSNDLSDLLSKPFVVRTSAGPGGKGLDYRVGQVREFRVSGIVDEGRPTFFDRSWSLPKNEEERQKEPTFTPLYYDRGPPFHKISELFEAVEPMIVRIEVTGKMAVLDETAKEGRYKDAGYQQVVGTGFVIDGRGYVLTNHHVTAPPASRWTEGPEVRVLFNAALVGRQFFKATIIGSDPESDLAVLHVQPDAAAQYRDRTSPQEPSAWR